ncbi:hypothetical protein QVD17_07153 [Tagetes erecta]|uniref:Uncharacterized protein n=1 Tax=Tagetes erecta TaxID=13708 RepID=A0AAD8LLM8_TARER|nr:hypothetical protein QVD17_07153 [Tagetes erecta]
MVMQVNRKESLDQNEITKAAAWAWYERGSWFDHKTIREVDGRRPHEYTCRPSRYKLEAMKGSQKECNDNSLFDMYEIERISRELCCYMESSKVNRRSRAVEGSRSVVTEETKGKRTRKKYNWGWRRHGIVCGSSEDVVERTLLAGGRRERKLDVPVVRVKSFRRATVG